MFKQRVLLWVILFGGVHAFAGGHAYAEASKVQLVLTGSSTVAPLAAEIGRRFEKKYPDVRIDVQSGGSSRGIADAVRGLADIGMVSRDLYVSEKHLWVFPIAYDGITLIVHKSNSVGNLNNDTVKQIFEGRIKNWKTLGGHDAPITVVNKAAGHSTLGLFTEYFHLEKQKIRASVVIGDNAQGIKTVAGNPDAIGYVSVGAATYDAQQGVPIKLLPVDQIPPTFSNMQSGLFPILRPLNFVTSEAPGGWIKTFIRFAQSPEIQPVIQEQYFVPRPE